MKVLRTSSTLFKISTLFSLEMGESERCYYRTGWKAHMRHFLCWSAKSSNHFSTRKGWLIQFKSKTFHYCGLRFQWSQLCLKISKTQILPHQSGVGLYLSLSMHEYRHYGQRYTKYHQLVNDQKEYTEMNMMTGKGFAD